MRALIAGYASWSLAAIVSGGHPAIMAGLTCVFFLAIFGAIQPTR
jgi:hypothetical protein